MDRRVFVGGAALLALAAAAGAPAQDARRVAGIVFQQDQFFNKVQAGMQAAADAAGAELLLANSESRPEREQSLADTYATQGVDAIVVSPLNPQASEQAFRRAAEAGSTVVTYNTFNMTWDFIGANVTSRQEDLSITTGRNAVPFIEERLGGRAVIGTIGFNALDATVTGLRTEPFLQTLRDAGIEVEVVSQQDAWLAERAVAVAGDMLTANPEINILYAANEGGTVGAVQAVRNAGRQGEVFVFGIDGSEQLADMLLDPDDVLQATTAQSPFQIGRIAVENALAVLDGRTVERDTFVPVVGLTRTDPAGVEAFKADWVGG